MSLQPLCLTLHFAVLSYITRWKLLIYRVNYLLVLIVLVIDVVGVETLVLAC